MRQIKKDLENDGGEKEREKRERDRTERSVRSGTECLHVKCFLSGLIKIKGLSSSLIVPGLLYEY